MKSKSQIKKISIQQEFLSNDMIKVVQEPENSWNKLLELKNKYNISDRDFEHMLFYAVLHYKCED